MARRRLTLSPLTIQKQAKFPRRTAFRNALARFDYWPLKRRQVSTLEECQLRKRISVYVWNGGKPTLTLIGGALPHAQPIFVLIAEATV